MPHVTVKSIPEKTLRTIAPQLKKIVVSAAVVKEEYVTTASCCTF